MNVFYCMALKYHVEWIGQCHRIQQGDNNTCGKKVWAHLVFAFQFIQRHVDSKQGWNMLTSWTPTLMDLAHRLWAHWIFDITPWYNDKDRVARLPRVLWKLEVLDDELNKTSVSILKLRDFLNIHLGHYREAWIDLSNVHELAPNDRYVSVYQKLCFLDRAIIPNYLRQASAKYQLA